MKAALAVKKVKTRLGHEVEVPIAGAYGDASDPVITPTIDDLDIDPNEPYPTGSPPDPAIEYERIHGFPPAVITSLSPNTAVCGAAEDIVMSVIGTGFNTGSKIWFGTYEEPTVFVSDTEVTTIVKPSLFPNPDAIPVWIANVHSGSTTDSLPFTMTEGAPPPETTRKVKQ